MAIQKKTTVKQSYLAAFRDAQTRLKDAKDVVKLLEDNAKKEELYLLRAYHAGALVERGELIFTVTEKERRSIKWKEEYATKLGPQAVEDIINLTIPTISEEVKVIRKVKETRKSTLKSA